MANSDPTAELYRRFEDPSEWGLIDDAVPIFVEHVVRDKNGKEKYRIVKPELEKIAAKINENDKKRWKPIKDLIGHTIIPTKDNPTPSQQSQPTLVGYSRCARVERWGPEGIWAVKVKRYIEKPYADEMHQYPERSPEFFPSTYEITAVSHLKTEPRLSMGMVISRPGGMVQYSRGFAMADNDDFELADDDGKAGADVESDPAKTAGVPIGEPNGDELSEDDKNKAEAYMRHYQRSCPWMSHAMKQYEAAMVSPSAMNGSLPGSTGEKETAEADKGKPEQFARQDTPEQYAALAKRVADAEAELAAADAGRIVAQLQAQRIKFDPKKLHARLLNATKEGRADIYADAVEHYAREAGDPSHNPWIDVASPTVTTIDPNDAGEFEPTTEELIRYGAKPSDDHGWREAREKLILEKRTKRAVAKA